MTVSSYIAKVLEEEGRTKIWLSELLGITKQKMNYRFQHDSFSANELIKIANSLDMNLEKLRFELSEERSTMNILSTIARNTKNMVPVGRFEDDFAVTVEYGIETETKILKVWNSSNQEAFDHELALHIIAEELDEGAQEGEFGDGNFNSIRWEVVEK